MDGKGRKLYLTDPTKPIPKTTAWRLGKRNSNSTNSSQKRRAYYRDGSCSVPQSTLWMWKKKDYDSDECEEEFDTGEHEIDNGSETDECVAMEM